MSHAFLGSADLRTGSRDSDRAGDHVSFLQAQLRRLQVLGPEEEAAPGLFDAGTELAVRRFQWFAGHVPGALDALGNFVQRPPVRLAPDGVVDETTKRLIRTFMENRWSATGLLVRLRFDRLTHTRPNNGFAALLGGDPNIGLCEREFAGVMVAMDAAARGLGVFIFVNQLFRAEGGRATLADSPTSFSPHRIGRAVDLQLGSSEMPRSGCNPQPATSIKNAEAGSPFANFRQHAKVRLRCRYGGDFDPVDPPHFDRQILPSGSSTWRMHFFFDQLQYRQALLNPAAIAGLA